MLSYWLLADICMAFQVEADPQGLLGGWIQATPANASVAPGQTATVVLMYNISQSGFQGSYIADVLITTNARPVAKVLYAHQLLNMLR